MTKYTLAVLNGMLLAELESVRDGGDEERRQLSDTVISLISTPTGWRVNAEYRGEFGGGFPVQVRWTPDEDGDFSICLCSPSEMALTWSLFIVAHDGSVNRVLHHAGVLEPHLISDILNQIAVMRSFNCAPATIAELLTGEDAA